MLIISIIISILSAAFLGVCQEVEVRIYGGNIAQDGQFPYVAMFSYEDGTYCGASIIHQRWLLTAAHCILNKPNPLITVGCNRPRQGGTSYNIETFVVHRNYTVIEGNIQDSHWNVTNDVVLIRVSRNITFDAYVQAIQLSSNLRNTYENSVGTLAGWGLTSTNAPNPEDLLFANLRVINNQECQQRNPYFYILLNHMCTSTKSGLGCKGDSGAPFVINGIQVGIVVASDPYCQPQVPTVYTLVADFVLWIREQLAVYKDFI